MKKKKLLSRSSISQQASASQNQALIRSFLLNPATHLILIVVAGVAIYSNTFHAPFVLDDVTSVYGNPAVRNFKLAFKPRMVGDFSFALNYYLGGVNVAGYHLVNLIIHLVNGGLVYAFNRLILGRSSQCRISVAEEKNLIPLFATLFFICHPVQTQAVTYIAQRVASLATLFYLATIVLWLYAKLYTSGIQRYLIYGASFATALFAMGTKEIAFTLPVIILLIEIVFLQHQLRRLAVPAIIFSFAATMIPAAFIVVGSKAGGLTQMLSNVITPTNQVSRGDYLLTQFNVLVTYLRLLVFPVGQNLDYDYPIVHEFFSLPVVASASLITAMLVGAVLLLVRAQRSNDHDLKLMGFGILWFFITISIESSLIPLQDVIFEHRLYLPSIGICVAFVTALLAVKQSLDEKIKPGGALVIPGLAIAVLILAVISASRNEVWKDEVTLWEDVAAKSPAKARPHGSLGSAYQKRGLVDAAAREYETAIKIDPRNPASFNNLGTIYHLQKKWEAAAQMYREALKLEPANVKAHYNLGLVCSELGRLREAETELAEAIRLKQDYDEAHNSLGIIYAKLHRNSDALTEFREAARLNPSNKEAVRNVSSLTEAMH